MPMLRDAFWPPARAHLNPLKYQRNMLAVIGGLTGIRLVFGLMSIIFGRGGMTTREHTTYITLLALSLGFGTSEVLPYLLLFWQIRKTHPYLSLIIPTCLSGAVACVVAVVVLFPPNYGMSFYLLLFTIADVWIKGIFFHRSRYGRIKPYEPISLNNDSAEVELCADSGPLAFAFRQQISPSESQEALQDLPGKSPGRRFRVVLRRRKQTEPSAMTSNVETKFYSSVEFWLNSRYIIFLLIGIAGFATLSIVGIGLQVSVHIAGDVQTCNWKCIIATIYPYVWLAWVSVAVVLIFYKVNFNRALLLWLRIWYGMLFWAVANIVIWLLASYLFMPAPRQFIGCQSEKCQSDISLAVVILFFSAISCFSVAFILGSVFIFLSKQE